MLFKFQVGGNQSRQFVVIGRIVAVMFFLFGLGGAVQTYLALRSHEVWYNYHGIAVGTAEMYIGCLVCLAVSIFGAALFLVLWWAPK
jgi:hypothetical protein